MYEADYTSDWQYNNIYVDNKIKAWDELDKLKELP